VSTSRCRASTRCCQVKVGDNIDRMISVLRQTLAAADA
jgi:hypothetical protein